MTIEVRIPTILRPYTDGERAVDGKGDTVAELIEHLEVNHAGIKERLVEDGVVRRFVNVYVNDEDIRYTGGLETSLADGDTVVILPAVAGGGRFDDAEAAAGGPPRGPEGRVGTAVAGGA
jgi:molybdopterin converting factor small subunit